MPIYEYECTKCGNHDEVIQKFSDRPLTKCGQCSGKLVKLVSQGNFHLKGTGWYVTDYANKSSSKTSEKPKSTESSSSSKKVEASAEKSDKSSK
ncbi:MAG: zinc ribbon domain-containing protein [Desulfobacterales bacterium]|jgi:putative FmdB family regulatory protein|nr:zinc ribbon domain-containing protein [Desulfobacterales bacterium]